ncbi:hypothetical protein [Acetobacter indonesiensis]|uniref:hypothetical protein n=1 Tax=Acetobacter indonesiensis TaxID=104101 RepID=UPI0020A56A50|nr:hypothetical protein [Acetobacter indonesiensis]MCP1231757.1 hypothetical protein [Acetobacter indonesiensis]
MNFVKLTAPETGAELHVDMDKVDAMHLSKTINATFLHGINLFVKETPHQIKEKAAA